jgi:tetratricopeptide (TPR) repeat protein
MIAVTLTLMLMQDLDAADRVFFARKYGEALELYRPLAEKGNVEALAQVARCLSLTGKLEEGKGWLERARKAASKDEPPGWSRYLGVRGIFEREGGDRKTAQATFEEMHAYCVEKGLHRRAIDAVHHIALVAPVKEQPAWALKGIAAAEQLKDDASLAVLWNNLGSTYEELKRLDRMLEAYLRARDYHYKSGGDVQKLVADWAVGHGYRLNGKLEEARDLLEPTLAWAERRHGKEPGAATIEWVGLCRKDLGETLSGLGEKARATELLKAARADLVKAGYEKSWPAALKEIDEALGKLASPH